MGLFSFLTGKKDEPGATMLAEPAVSPAPDASTSTTAAIAPEPSAAAPAPPTADTSSGWDSTFTAPEAWNTGALTAPVETPATDPPQIGETDPAETAALQGPIIEALKTVYDPEIPVDIYELGLIYEILVDKEHRVLVKMTLTSPACPSAQQLPSEVRYKVKAVPGVTNAWVEIVWEPAWSKERMSEAAKLALGFF